MPNRQISNYFVLLRQANICPQKVTLNRFQWFFMERYNKSFELNFCFILIIKKILNHRVGTKNYVSISSQLIFMLFRICPLTQIQTFQHSPHKIKKGQINCPLCMNFSPLQVQFQVLAGFPSNLAVLADGFQISDMGENF